MTCIFMMIVQICRPRFWMFVAPPCSSHPSAPSPSYLRVDVQQCVGSDSELQITSPILSWQHRISVLRSAAKFCLSVSLIDNSYNGAVHSGSCLFRCFLTAEPLDIVSLRDCAFLIVNCLRILWRSRLIECLTYLHRARFSPKKIVPLITHRIMDDAASIESASAAGTTASAGTKRKRATEPKFYAVRVGNRPGIYHTWADCLEQVKGFKKATCTLHRV